MRTSLSFFAAVATVLGPLSLIGAESDGIAFFEKRIRPLFVEHCYECHSQEAGKRKGGLLLDSREGWEAGGDSGQAINPGDPAKSRLLFAVQYHQGEDLQMPPDGKLPARSIDDLAQWILMGAPDPRRVSKVVKRSAASQRPAKAHWAFQPLSKPEMPSLVGTANRVDAFLTARLLREGLEPLQEADRFTWLRRVYFTLVGMPPTTTAIRAFLADGTPTARERVVDGLLGSSHFGERWGRHWLDVARFGESSGGGRSLMFPDAWRYRDFVIQAMNDDMPIDAFIKEQLAGDLLKSSDDLTRNRRVVASGFLALGPTNYEQQDKELLRMDVIDEQIDTLGGAFLGLTLGCVRCHEHKFDPISTEDYYALAGVFRSTKSLVPGNVSGYVETYLESPAKVEVEAHAKRVREAVEALALAEAARNEVTTPERVAKVNALREQVAALKKQAPKPAPKAMSVIDEPDPADWHIHIRGGIRNHGPLVPRHFLPAVTPNETVYRPEIPAGQSGRLQLAEWLVHPENALTPRVYVNRVWSKVFGEGLVRTVDNFGSMGEEPSHPALLDDLVWRFRESGWSTKWLVRELVLTEAFARESESCGPGVARDPDNRFYWRAHRRRLEAEAMRDAILMAGGSLDFQQGGLTITKLAEYDYGYEFTSIRRSVYVPAFRNTSLPVNEVFDRANPNVVTGKRTVTNLPAQALYFLNNPWVQEQSASAAARYRDMENPLETAYLEILGRFPTRDEVMLAETFLGGEGSHASVDRWALLVQSLFASLDFRFLN